MWVPQVPLLGPGSPLTPISVFFLSLFPDLMAGDPLIRIPINHRKLCPVHRSFIAMSGRVEQV